MSDTSNSWDWIEETFLPNLYYTEDYRGLALNEYNEKFLANGVNMRLGPPRLRQIRINPRTSHIFSGKLAYMYT